MEVSADVASQASLGVVMLQLTRGAGTKVHGLRGKWLLVGIRDASWFLTASTETKLSKAKSALDFEKN